VLIAKANAGSVVALVARFSSHVEKDPAMHCASEVFPEWNLDSLGLDRGPRVQSNAVPGTRLPAARLQPVVTQSKKWAIQIFSCIFRASFEGA
jgi:hypothetical protein